MLSQAQRNLVFTNIQTVYTVDSHSYTAVVTYPAHWSGEIETPIILLNYPSDARLKQSMVGRIAEWDTARLSGDVFARNDVVNGVAGIKIVRHIARELSLWLKQSGTAALSSERLYVAYTEPVQDLSHLEEKVYRMHLVADLMYKLF